MLLLTVNGLTAQLMFEENNLKPLADCDAELNRIVTVSRIRRDDARMMKRELMLVTKN